MTTIRLICNDVPKQWHDCSDDFIQRLEAYCIKSKADIWVQYYDGHRSRSAPK